MSTSYSPLLRTYLAGLGTKLKTSLMKELAGNHTPTLEEIRQAMQRAAAEGEEDAQAVVVSYPTYTLGDQQDSGAEMARLESGRGGGKK